MAGASAGPHFDEESHTPVAKPRSFAGNHAAVIFAEVGQHGASPTASSARITSKPDIEPTTPVSHVATLHQIMPSAYARFAPKRSITQPAGNCITAYVHANTLPSSPICVRVRPSS